MGDRLDLRPLPTTRPKDELDHELVSLDAPDLALPDSSSPVNWSMYGTRAIGGENSEYETLAPYSYEAPN